MLGVRLYGCRGDFPFHRRVHDSPNICRAADSDLTAGKDDSVHDLPNCNASRELLKYVARRDMTPDGDIAQHRSRLSPRLTVQLWDASMTNFTTSGRAAKMAVLSQLSMSGGREPFIHRAQRACVIGTGAGLGVVATEMTNEKKPSSIWWITIIHRDIFVNDQHPYSALGTCQMEQLRLSRIVTTQYARCEAEITKACARCKTR